jgi:hypothetical protein
MTISLRVFVGILVALACAGCERSAPLEPVVVLGKAVRGLPVAPVRVDTLEHFVAPSMISLIVQGDNWKFYYVRFKDAQTLTFQAGKTGRWNDLVAPKLWLNERPFFPNSWVPTSSFAMSANSADGFRGLLDDASAIAAEPDLGHSCDPEAGFGMRAGPVPAEPPDVYVIWGHHRSSALGCDERGLDFLHDALHLLKQLGLRQSDTVQVYPSP